LERTKDSCILTKSLRNIKSSISSSLKKKKLPFSLPLIYQLKKNAVTQALKANPDNEGKTFIIDYEVNPALQGGLQMYTENKFMDLSLSSRIDRIKDEISKLV